MRKRRAPEFHRLDAHQTRKHRGGGGGGGEKRENREEESTPSSSELEVYSDTSCPLPGASNRSADAAMESRLTEDLGFGLAPRHRGEEEEDEDVGMK